MARTQTYSLTPEVVAAVDAAAARRGASKSATVDRLLRECFGFPIPDDRHRAYGAALVAKADALDEAVGELFDDPELPPR